MARILTTLGAAFALLAAVPAQADPALDAFAREVERTEGVRQVKDLQRLLAQYAQFGLWNEVGALFAPDAVFTFDGSVGPAQTATGPQAIAAFLRARYGGGYEGTSARGLSTIMIDSPVANLSPDGQSAKARWGMMIFHGHAGEARIEGGVLVADYVRERGVWTIGAAHYYPQFDGPYERGWTNWGGGDLPQIPHHFDYRTAGIPLPPAAGTAPRTQATLVQLQARVARMNDQDRVRGLQSAYGFYADRKMWDDVVDLFADDGVVEIGGQGLWRGKDGVRRWLEGSMGPAGLTHGQLNDQVQLDVTVEVAPGGAEAWARGIELGMLGEADHEQGWWQVTAFLTRFVHEDGVWKIRELRRFPMMKTDIFQGWGKSLIADEAPAGRNAPGAGVPAGDDAAMGLAMPAFLGNHPVTGEPIEPDGDGVLVAARPLTGAIAGERAMPVDLAEAERRLGLSKAFEGVSNVSAAYGFYIDDSIPQGFGSMIAAKGSKMTPFAGYHVTREHVLSARVAGEVPATRPGISYHWLTQPVIMVADDGRSAGGRLRLFQMRTGKETGEDGAFFGASFWGGMYHNQYVLEDGTWRIWDLTLDEPYIVPVKWTDGVWARAKDPAPADMRRTFSSGNFPPDIPLAELGPRFEHFWGGPGETRQWPSILPMWFMYRNPVSGREPELFQDGCVPCSVRPELKLENNGYQEPPDAPEMMRGP